MKVELLGLSDKKTIERQVNICAAAGKLSRMPGSVFDAMDSMKDYDTALKFIQRVIGMGHTSTIDHDYLVFALSDVSPVIEQTVIAERFSSFTVKSRREVDFSNVGFYVPDFHDEDGNVLSDNTKLKEKYCDHMQSLFESYAKFADNGISKEDARFVLPYSYHSQFIMGLDGTSLARMIHKLTKSSYSKITELKELGEKLKEIALKRAPYIESLLKKEEMHEENKVALLLQDIVPKRDYSLLDKPVLLSSTKDIDKTIFINAIARISSLDIDAATQIYEEKIDNDKELKEKLMKAIMEDEEHEDIKHINLRFQLAIPFAILTHYTRHRRLSLSIPAFVPNVDLEKYVMPPSIKTSELKEFYDDVYKRNKDVYDEFKKYGVREEDLVYFTLSGNAINVIINFDGEAFRWICRLRECTKAQWRIREDVTRMHALVNKVSSYYAKNLGPDCVTKHVCGEGKESCGRIDGILAKLKEKTH
ncbi:MAG: FAD-dependent thymidylate synthase [Bacilli bacterium]|nr:FAD-dependent thymidylate synthase [Bacilli bacterium]